MEIYEVSLVDFLFVTVFLGGGAAWLTGRATAWTWSAWWKLVLYVVLLTFALRFIHFALFEGSFFLPLGTFWRAVEFAVPDFVVLMIAAVVGRVLTRSRQMSRQYGFLTRGPVAPETA